MTRITRGFHGRRRPDVDPARVPPGQYETKDFPVLSAGPTPRGSLETWTFTIRGQVDRAAPGRGTSSKRWRTRRSRGTSTASRSGRSSTRSGKACPLTRCSPPRDSGDVRGRVLRRWLYHQSSACGRHRRQGVDCVLLRWRAAAPSTAGPPDCSCRICTSGRAPSGCAGCDSAARTSPASGSGSATTTAAIRGASSAIRAIELARRTVAGADRADRRARTARLRRPGWTGHRAGQHVDVRLSAEDGYRAQRSYSIASRAGDRTSSSRSSGSTTARSRPTWRMSCCRAMRSSARPDRRLLRLGGGAGHAAGPGRRRLGGRAAAGDAPTSRARPAAPFRCGCCTRRARSRTSSTGTS